MMLTYRLMKPPWCSILISGFPISDSRPRAQSEQAYYETKALLFLLFLSVHPNPHPPPSPAPYVLLLGQRGHRIDSHLQ